jgi:myosin heavy subunit
MWRIHENPQVMLAWEIDDSQWTLGTSRLFLKAGQLRALEELRDSSGQASQHVIKKIRQQFPDNSAIEDCWLLHQENIWIKMD